MWRDHYKVVFKAEEVPYSGDLLEDVAHRIDKVALANSPMFLLSEVNDAISLINTDKSYTRHYHWATLQGSQHSAILCMLEVFNCWARDVVSDKNQHTIWTPLIQIFHQSPKMAKKIYQNANHIGQFL